MKYLLILSLLLTCNTPKLVVIDRCDEEAMNNFLKVCIDEYNPANRRELDYFSEICRDRAKKLFYHKDSVVVCGKDTTKWNVTPVRIKNRITNIKR